MAQNKTQITKEWLNKHFEYDFNPARDESYWHGYDDQAGLGCTITIATELKKATYYKVVCPFCASEYGKGYSSDHVFFTPYIEDLIAFLSLCGDMSYLVDELNKS